MFRKKQIAHLITNLSVDNFTQSKSPKNQKFCMSVEDYENKLIQINPKHLFSNTSSNKNKKISLVVPVVLPSSNKNSLHLKQILFKKEINGNKNSTKKLKIINPYSNKIKNRVSDKICQTPDKIKLTEFKEFRINELQPQKEIDINELSKYYENLLKEKESIIQKLLTQINYYKKLLFKNNNISSNINMKLLSEDSSDYLIFDSPDSNRTNNNNFYLSKYKQIYPKENENDCKLTNFNKLNLKLNNRDYSSKNSKNVISRTSDIRKFNTENINNNSNYFKNGINSERKTLKDNNNSYYKLCHSPSFLFSSREKENKNIESHSTRNNIIYSKNFISNLNINENSYDFDNKCKSFENEDLKNQKILLGEIQFRMLTLFDGLYGFILRMKYKN